MSLNILNPKALERQLKILETEIGKLQVQIDDLEKMRAACLTLLGTANPEALAPKESAVAKPEGEKEKAAKKPAVAAEDLPPRILDLLRQKETGMTADEIFDALKTSGVALKGKRPVALVYSTLENHPEMFLQAENGFWVESTRDAGESTH